MKEIEEEKRIDCKVVKMYDNNRDIWNRQRGWKKLIRKVNKSFWKTEKLLFFFCSISLYLFVISIVLMNQKYETCFLYEWIRGEECGILSLSIFLGYLFVWYYSIQERKKFFSVLQMLGVSKWKLQVALQAELFKFQLIATIFLIAFFYWTGNEIAWFEVLKSIFRIHLELQMVLGSIVWGMLQLSKENEG